MTKPLLREQLLSSLRAMTPHDREHAGTIIARRIWEIPQVSEARTLLLYADLPTEVPTDQIARDAIERGIVVTYPRCIPETREMELARVASLTELEAGSYGIREPATSCAPLGVEEIDVALVPGVGFDRDLRRLGRGGGYYDRLFANPGWHGFRCGIFFALQEVERLPQEPWDQRLDAVVTEADTIL